MKYVARCELGEVHRTSQRTYTHAVLLIRDGRITGANWCGSGELAIKQARRISPGWVPLIVPVEIT